MQNYMVELFAEYSSNTLSHYQCKFYYFCCTQLT